MFRLLALLLALVAASPASAQLERNKVARFGPPGWVMRGADGTPAAIDLDCAHQLFWPPTLLSQAAIVRASTAYEDGADGTWYPFPSGQMRISTKGCLIEQTRTNSIRNNTMVGAGGGSTTHLEANGTFSACSGSTCTGWSTTLNGGTGSVTFSAGNAALAGDGTNNASIYQSITSVAGMNYLLTVVNAAGHSVIVHAGSTQGGTAYLANQTLAASTVGTYVFNVTGTTLFIQVDNTSATPANITSVSVQATGSAPTNWSNASPLNGVSAIFGTPFVSQGINWVPISVIGTATSSNGSTNLFSFEGAQAVAALYGQTWTESFFAYSSGTLPAFSINETARQANGSGIGQEKSCSVALTATPTRFSCSYTPTLPSPATAFMLPRIYFNVVNTTVYNGVVNIGWPQLEQDVELNSTVGSAAVSNNGTSGCASGTYTVSGGTGTAATLTGTAAGGVVTGLAVLSAGSYSVFPPSPAALTGTGCSGAPTANLTPADNSSQAFATSPIPTTSAAATRATDVVSFPLSNRAVPTSGYSLMFSATPNAPAAFTGNQTIHLDDGTGNNRLTVARASISGNTVATEVVGGVSATSTGASWSQGTLAKIVGFANAATVQLSFNGGAPVSTAQAGPAVVNTLRLINTSSVGGLFGYLSRVTVAPTSLLKN